MNNKAIYTAIFGNYDVVSPLSFKPDGYDFYLFSDQKIKSDFWNVITIDSSDGLDNTRKARFLKVNGHPILNKYDMTIWIDGNIDVISEISTVEEEMADYDICTFKHPSRNCIYKEAIACSICMKDSFLQIVRQVFFYIQEKYPVNNGLIESNVLIRKNTPQVREFCDLWWYMIKSFSKRDQLSFNYVAWRLSLDYCVWGDENARGSNDLFRLRGSHYNPSIHRKIGRFVRSKLSVLLKDVF